MSSKLVKLSFPEEDIDVYNLLKSKARPSKFVAEAIRYYQLNKGKKQSLSQKEIQEIIDEQVKTQVAAEVKKVKQTLEQQISQQIKAQLKGVILVQTTAATVEELPAESKEVGAINLNALEDTSSVDFSKAISMFDDDD